jgi:hypothetical protein
VNAPGLFEHLATGFLSLWLLVFAVYLIRSRQQRFSHPDIRARPDDQGFWVNLGCTKATTVNRTNVLNDRIRECKATGCQPSKL